MAHNSNNGGGRGGNRNNGRGRGRGRSYRRTDQEPDGDASRPAHSQPPLGLPRPPPEFPPQRRTANAIAPAPQSAMPAVTESDDDGSAADHYSMNLVAPSSLPSTQRRPQTTIADDVDPYVLAAQSLPSGWREEDVARLLNRDDADALLRATVYVGHNNAAVTAVVDTGSGPSWINSDTLRRIDAGVTDPRLRCPVFTRAPGGNAVYTADGKELPRNRQVLLSLAFDEGVHVEQAGPHPPRRVTMLIMAYVVSNLVAPLIIGNGALRQHRAVLRPAEHRIEFKGMRLKDGTTADISVSTLRSGSVSDADSSSPCNVIVAPNAVQRARQAARDDSNATQQAVARCSVRTRTCRHMACRRVAISFTPLAAPPPQERR